jgi:anti-sigma factor RsiW
MSCAKFENDVALYAGGDLPAGRIARVESHLAECADCRALAGELSALLSGLRDEPLDDEMVAQVHHRVLAEVQRRAGFSRRGALAPLLALAAAVILAVVLLWPRHHANPVPLARMEPAPVTPVPRPNTVPVAPVHHRVVKHHRRRAPADQPSGPPLLVQFVTDNPDIVIYWLIDRKQGD